MKAKKLLITGAGGFIGQVLVQKALQQKYHVVGIETSPQKAQEVQDKFGIEVIQGGIQDKHIRQEGLKDAKIIINTAAIMKESGPIEEFRKINVEATYQLADEAKKNKAEIFVQLSSVMVYGFHYPPFVTEDGPLDGSGSAYAQTKIEGENALIPLNQPPKFGVIILRPGDVYGPGSIPWVVRPLEVEAKGLFALPGGGKGTINLCYVENLADAVFLAIKKKVFATPINITDGTPITWKEYFTDLMEIAGRKPPRSLPYSIVKTMVAISSPIFKMMYGESPLSPEGIDFIMRPHPVSNARAVQLLGYKPKIDYKTGMENIRKWLESQKQSTVSQ